MAGQRDFGLATKVGLRHQQTQAKQKRRPTHVNLPRAYIEFFQISVPYKDTRFRPEYKQSCQQGPPKGPNANEERDTLVSFLVLVVNLRHDDASNDSDENDECQHCVSGSFHNVSLVDLFRNPSSLCVQPDDPVPEEVAKGSFSPVSVSPAQNCFHGAFFGGCHILFRGGVFNDVMDDMRDNLRRRERLYGVLVNLQSGTVEPVPRAGTPVGPVARPPDGDTDGPVRGLFQEEGVRDIAK